MGIGPGHERVDRALERLGIGGLGCSGVVSERPKLGDTAIFPTADPRGGVQQSVHLLGFGADGGPTLREVAVEEGDRFVLCTRHVRAVLDDDALMDVASMRELDGAREELLARLHLLESRNRYRANTVVITELRAAEPGHGDDGASHRPPRSWLYNPGAPLPEPTGQWPHPDAAWFREVYGLIMGEDG